jgi:hypothetical protein
VTSSDQWVGVALGFGIGLWWMLTPRAAIGFYRAVGLKFPEELGPIGLRILGVLPLGLGAAFLVDVLLGTR